MKRILVIRGGAIGDFLLILPALNALREAWPDSHIEVLGYKHIAEVVNGRYANAVRSIESADLAPFFSAGGVLPPRLMDHFGSFDLAVSYLYDPDRIFEDNLRRCGLTSIVRGPAKIADDKPAVRQLSEPLEQLGFPIKTFSVKLSLSETDRAAAKEFLRDLARPIVAIHPGSGSKTKNWPIQNWIELGSDLLQPTSNYRSLVIVGGEADIKQIDQIKSALHGPTIHYAHNLPLPHLAAILENTLFIGHDSGISHLAAATGAECVLLFGPTDPNVWAPRGDNVTVIRAPDNNLNRLDSEAVWNALSSRTRGQN